MNTTAFKNKENLEVTVRAIKVRSKVDSVLLRKGWIYYLIPELVDINFDGKLTMCTVVKKYLDNENWVCAIYNNEDVRKNFEVIQ